LHEYIRLENDWLTAKNTLTYDCNKLITPTKSFIVQTTVCLEKHPSVEITAEDQFIISDLQKKQTLPPYLIKTQLIFRLLLGATMG
jgi:hypothetical protein